MSRWLAPGECNSALGLRVSLRSNLQTQESTSTPRPCDVSHRQSGCQAPPPSSSNHITTIFMAAFRRTVPMPLTGLDACAMSSLSDPSAMPRSLHLDVHISANTPVPNAQGGVCGRNPMRGPSFCVGNSTHLELARVRVIPALPHAGHSALIT